MRGAPHGAHPSFGRTAEYAVSLNWQRQRLARRRVEKYDKGMSKAKIAITLEVSTLAQVRAEVRARRGRSVSAYISDAVNARLESDAIARLVEDLRSTHGRPSPKARQWARAVLAQ